MNYIVKNCPNYFKTHSGDYCDLDTGCCLYRTDCVIKQVIEKCKDKIRIYEYYDKDYALGQVKCAKSILQLFDIEEINK